jgi:hypothetical protein
MKGRAALRSELLQRVVTPSDQRGEEQHQRKRVHSASRVLLLEGALGSLANLRESASELSTTSSRHRALKALGFAMFSTYWALE